METRATADDINFYKSQVQIQKYCEASKIYSTRHRDKENENKFIFEYVSMGYFSLFRNITYATKIKRKR